METKKGFLFLFLLALQFRLLFTLAETITDSIEVLALQNLYKSLNEPKQLRRWTLEEGDPCGEVWMGISCSDSSIVELQLRGLKLQGNLGNHLQDLHNLKKNLDISFNNLQGEIPYGLSLNAAHLENIPQKSSSLAERLSAYPASLRKLGINEDEFTLDTNFWREQVNRYWELMKVNKTEVRNVMDTNAFIGGFAAAMNSYPVWIMNVVPATMNNTLSAVYQRGLTGAYHDWCEPFSTYPRTYDLLHADSLLSHYQNHGDGCLLEDIMLEMDRIIRPQGFIIIRDEETIISKVKDMACNNLTQTIPLSLPLMTQTTVRNLVGPKTQS